MACSMNEFEYGLFYNIKITTQHRNLRCWVTLQGGQTIHFRVCRFRFAFASRLNTMLGEMLGEMLDRLTRALDFSMIQSKTLNIKHSSTFLKRNNFSLNESLFCKGADKFLRDIMF